MHHRITWLLALMLTAGLVSATDLAGMKERGTLRVIAQEGEAPEMFRFDSAGEPGFEREMIRGFAALQGLALEIVSVPKSAARIPALLRGDGDVIIGIVNTPVVAVLATALPESEPIRPLLKTATFAGPPALLPSSRFEADSTYSVAPVASRM